MRSQALPRRWIIRERKLLREARSTLAGKIGRAFSLYHGPLVSPEKGKVAFLTPRKLGAASVRHRVRRRMREICRRWILPLDSNRRLIWVARGAAVDLNFEEMKAAMQGLYRQINKQGGVQA